MTTSVGVHEAKTQRSKLLREVAAGAEVVITRRGVPAARLVGAPPRTGRRFGSARGMFTVPGDVDRPLPDEVLDAFEGR